MRPLTAPRRAPRGRPDPGPSLWRYRARRAWANPMLRGFVKGYLPLVALGLAGWGVVATDSLRLWIAERAESAVAELVARPEFAVRRLEIAGATPGLAREVRALVGDVGAMSSLALDLGAKRAEIEAIPAVRRAELFLDPGGVLTVTLSRREPVALWRRADGGLALVDDEGVTLGEVGSRLSYPELPLVLGAGAPAAIGEALRLMELAPRIAREMRGLVRVGARRWDIAFGEGLRVMLPAENAEGALSGLLALERALELDGAVPLVARDLAAIDLRIAERPTLRARPEPTEAAPEAVARPDLRPGPGTPGPSPVLRAASAAGAAGVGEDI